MYLNASFADYLELSFVCSLTYNHMKIIINENFVYSHVSLDHTLLHFMEVNYFVPQMFILWNIGLLALIHKASRLDKVGSISRYE